MILDILPRYTELKNKASKNIPHDYNFNVSVLADKSSQFFVNSLKGYAISEKIKLSVFEAEYGQIEQEVLNQTSAFHEFESDFVIILTSSESLLEKFNASGQSKDFHTEYVDTVETWINLAVDKGSLILNNYPIITDNVYGNFWTQIEESFEYQLNAINSKLLDLAQKRQNLFICDINSLQATVGLSKRIDQKFYFSAQMAYSLQFLPLLAKSYIDIIKAIKGINLKKCLILDLDNTLWGGVIGDDGLNGIQIGNLGIGKAFSNLQKWALKLKERGIILCVCSKNTESVAEEPFTSHPDMVLSLDDISVFVANWENKADNIRYIQSVLNIGFDSMVFLDDNPFERNLVRSELPEVIVPELPADPVDYLTYIRSQNLFETASVSKEDADRTSRYKEEAKRAKTFQSFTSIDDYLESLEMIGSVSAFDEFSIPRVAQLTQRSNQFNLRTIRYTVEDIDSMHRDNNYMTLQTVLKDKFGDYGLISVVIGKIDQQELFIDTWIMSCRVLKRDVEKFVLNQIVKESKKLGITKIIGEWLETKKNIIVKDHYKNLGFQKDDNIWMLELSSFEEMKNYIEHGHS